jgi:hypothetical protein
MPATSTAGFDRQRRQADRAPARRLAAQKFFDSGQTANLARVATSTPLQARSVDKPMNIHRIECAKPRDLATAAFLSSFGPRQTQALFSSLKRR